MGNVKSNLEPETIADLQSNTAFSEDELANWYQGFIKDYPSGYLTDDEFERIYSNYFPYGDASKFAEYVFSKFDTNSDGEVDFREFICVVSVTSKGSLDAKLKWAFNIYDLDGDGFVTFEEMLEIFKALYKMVGTMLKLPDDEDTPEKKTTKIFQRADANLDGMLSLEEFIEGVKQDPSIVKLLQPKPAS